MPRYCSDSVTVLTGDSSLRNLAYQPSQQGSIDEESAMGQSDNDSVLSSVRSSVRRDLQKRKSQGATSTRSCSTRQSDGLMWQDTETEADVYASSSDDEEEQDSSIKPNCPSRERHKSITNCLVNNHSRKGRDTESISSTEGTNTSASDSNSEVRRPRRSKPNKERATLFQSKQKKSSKLSKQAPEPIKRLRFSTEALTELVQSRINEDRHTLHSTTGRENRTIQALYNVDYVTALDIASTNEGVSTIHSLGKEDCNEVFKDRVPFEVPVHDLSDDLSSIHALSTRVPVLSVPLPVRKTDEQVGVHLKEVAEERSVAIPIAENQEEDMIAPAKIEAVAITGERGWLHSIIANQGGIELFFAALVGVSFATLVILVIILFVL